jgi:hypothetical protein
LKILLAQTGSIADAAPNGGNQRRTPVIVAHVQLTPQERASGSRPVQKPALALGTHARAQYCPHCGLFGLLAHRPDPARAGPAICGWTAVPAAGLSGNHAPAARDTA